MKTKTRLFAVLLALSLLFSVSASAADGYLRGMEGYSYSNPAFSMNVMDDTLFLLNGKKLQAFTSAIEEPALICDFAKNPRTIVVQFSSFCSPLLEKCYFYKDFAQRVLAQEKKD